MTVLRRGIHEQKNIFVKLKDNAYLLYTILFILITLIIFSVFYLGGLTFISKGDGTLQGVSGALMYCFGSWGLRWTVDHPYFLTPLIYLPLMILGIEKILREKKILVFTLAVMFCALSNFYFFYMCGIMAAGYTVLRLALVYRRNIDELFRTFLRIALSAVWGFALSAVIFLPQLYSFIGNPRVGFNAAMKPVIDLEDMSKIPGMLLNVDNYWSISALAVPALILLFASRKKHLMLKIFAAAVPVMLIFKIFGSIFNGFAHSLDRWSFAVTFLSSYIFVLMWPEYIEGLKEKRRPVIISVIIYFFICILLSESRTENFFVTFSILGLLLVLLFSDLIIRGKRGYLLLASCLACVPIDGLYMYSPEECNYTDFVSEKEGLSETLYNNESETVRTAAALFNDKSFYRYSGSLGYNSGFLHGMSSTSFYWSTVSPWGQNFRSDLALLSNNVYIYFNYDTRTVANAISAVKYYVSNSGTVHTDRDKILYFALPYSTGWSAQVDGEPAALYCANDMYMAAFLPAGDHSVRLIYKTPLLREGALISAVSLVLLAGYIIINRRKKIAIMHA